MRFLRRSLTGLFLSALTVAALAMAAWVVRDAVETRMARSGGSMPARERVYSADVIRVEPETIEPELEAFGEVISARSLQIRARTAGTVVELADNFVDGGRVAAGQVLVRIDPADLEDNLALAGADQAEAEAEVRDAEQALLLERDDLTSAERQLELRQAATRRQQDLFDRGVGTAADLESARLTESSAEQAVLSARSALQVAEARVATAAVAVDRSRIALAEAERRLAEATIRAEFSGALADVATLEGGVVTANEQIATLVDPSTLEVSFRLSTAQYVRLLDAEGNLTNAPVAASLELSDVNLIAQGHVARESAAVGEGQTGRLIYAALDEARGFRPGDFVTVRLREPALENVARLPSGAISGAGTVLVLGADDRLEEASVEVIRRQGESVLIAAEALAGREVVADQTPTLGAGIKIRPQRDEDETDASAPGTTQNVIALDDARRARLISFVEASAEFPTRAKQRFLVLLKQHEVPAQVVERIEQKMGS